MIGNFPPRRCGIATFTRDLQLGIAAAAPAAVWRVVAVSEAGQALAYPPSVTDVIQQGDEQSYIAAAAALNASDAQVTFLQHEYGIFGGSAGEHILLLLRRLRTPVITTLHTVLAHPDADQRRVMDEIIRLSAFVVVMAEKGADILRRVHGVGPSKVRVAPHGAPSRALTSTEAYKTALGLQGKKVISTFGLLSNNKGLETIIEALPAVLAAHPDAVYLIAGATHPHLVARDGEAYRDSLVALASSLGVEHALRFINRYMGDEELIDILLATDVYVTPYLNEAQITSGTLSYAIALGRPIVSTPYWHAVEALSHGVGVICPFRDSVGFGREISNLLSDANRRNALSRRAAQAGAASRWPNVGRIYVDLAQGAIDAATRSVPPSPQQLRPSMQAVKRLFDDTGILQHGRHRVPDRAHGYCVDDNARALLLFARKSMAGDAADRDGRLAYTCAAFVNHSWNPSNGRFRNFMSYDRRWLDDGGGDDCCARAFQSLTATARWAGRQDLREWAQCLGREAFARQSEWSSLRARAHMIDACSIACGVFLSEAECNAVIAQSAKLLMDSLAGNEPWFEPKLSYDNARLANALMVAGRVLGDHRMTKSGVDALHWLMERQRCGRVFAPIGTSRFAKGDATDPMFDQQPLEVLASVEARALAFAITNDEAWKQQALTAFEWFSGANILGTSIATVDDGGCHDGLTAQGPNLNQGAESVLSFQLAALAAQNMLEAS